MSSSSAVWRACRLIQQQQHQPQQLLLPTQRSYSLAALTAGVNNHSHDEVYQRRRRIPQRYFHSDEENIIAHRRHHNNNTIATGRSDYATLQATPPLSVYSTLLQEQQPQQQQQPPGQQQLKQLASLHWIESLLVWWSQNKDQLPKGFENFFPKQGPASPPKAGTPSSSPNTNPESSSSSSSSKDKKGDDNFGGSTFSSEEDSSKRSSSSSSSSKPPPPPPDNNNDDGNNIPGLLLLLTLLVAFRYVMESDKNTTGAGPEITFQEFRRDYLLKGRVESIQVINQSVAKVFLKSPTPTHSSQVGVMNRTTTTHHNNTPTTTSLGGGSGSGGGTPEFTTDYGSSVSSPSSFSSGSSSGSTGVVHFYIGGSVEDLEEKLAKIQATWHPADWVDVHYVTVTNWMLEAFKLLPLLAGIGAMYFGSRLLAGGGGGFGMGGGSGRNGSGGSRGGGGGGIFSLGRSGARKIQPTDVKTTFADVAGCQEAKKEIMEFVEFLKYPARFQKLGAKIPKGALLSGPPGTGKTLLAKAVAGEAGVPFYSISGSDFIEMFVGVGPSRVRDLFREARQNAPCIVFIDEIDAVGRQRGRGAFGGGNDERENTLNQLLVEMDGFSSTTNIVVLAGTNRPDILDQALTRPGRFDRQITVDKPDLQGRQEIFLVHLKGITLEGAKEDYAGRLAGLTPGFAGADIANLCNEAAIVAARRKASAVGYQDFEKAADRIIGGLESHKIMSDQEKSIVAHHEAGHAIAGWMLEHTDPLLKVTIIPRTSGALGFAQYLPKEVFLRSREQIMDLVCMALAGRAAEQVFFGQVTTGASDDLRRVTRLVYSTIKDFGMNTKLGQLAFPDKKDGGNPGDRPYSESTAETMDEEARAMVDEAYQRAVQLITDHKEKVIQVAELLRDKETITHDDLIDLIGPRPYPGDLAYQEYVSSKPRRELEKEKEEKEEEQSQPLNSDLSEEDVVGKAALGGLV